MVRYLLDVTFCAGSNEGEDTDRGMYLFTPKEKNAKLISKVEMEEMLAETNRLCDPLNYDDDDVAEFPFTYDDGLNIDTLMDAFQEYTGGKVEEIQEELFMDNPGQLCYYQIEQWQ